MFFVGLIRLRSTPLPKLQGLEYILNVTATDDNASGGPQPLSSTARVIVGVDDVNNNKPVFEEVRIFFKDDYYNSTWILIDNQFIWRAFGWMDSAACICQQRWWLQT